MADIPGCGDFHEKQIQVETVCLQHVATKQSVIPIEVTSQLNRILADFDL